MVATNDISSEATNAPSADGQPYIRVNSVWKVFGRNPERVLEPEYSGQDKSFFQSARSSPDEGTRSGPEDVTGKVHASRKDQFSQMRHL